MANVRKKTSDNAIKLGDKIRIEIDYHDKGFFEVVGIIKSCKAPKNSFLVKLGNGIQFYYQKGFFDTWGELYSQKTKLGMVTIGRQG